MYEKKYVLFCCWLLDQGLHGRKASLRKCQWYPLDFCNVKINAIVLKLTGNFNSSTVSDKYIKELIKNMTKNDKA